MGGQGSGRKPSEATLVKRHFGNDRVIIPAGESFRIPNHSGDHSAGSVRKTPVDSFDITNKFYVDSITFWNRVGTTLSPKTSGDKCVVNGGFGVNNTPSDTSFDGSGDGKLYPFLFSQNTVQGFKSGIVHFNRLDTSPFFNMGGNATNSTIFGGGVRNDNFRRIRITAGGELLFGSGSSDSDTRLYRAAEDIIGTDGIFIEQGIYADICVHDNTTSQSIPTGTTYTKITQFTQNNLSSNCTADYSNNKITITKTGIYKVSGSFSFASGTANVNILGAAFLGGTEQDCIHFRRKISTANDEGSASFTGFIDVTTANTDLDFRVRHDNGASVNITFTYANLNVEYLGET